MFRKQWPAQVYASQSQQNGHESSTNLQKLHVAQMDIWVSPLSGDAKIKSIASVVAEKNAFKAGKIVKQFYYFLWTEKVGNTS